MRTRPAASRGGAMKTEAKHWFELQCRQCGQRFLETAKLVNHRCPGDAQKARRNRKPGWPLAKAVAESGSKWHS